MSKLSRQERRAEAANKRRVHGKKQRLLQLKTRVAADLARGSGVSVDGGSSLDVLAAATAAIALEEHGAPTPDQVRALARDVFDPSMASAAVKLHWRDSAKENAFDTFVAQVLRACKGASTAKMYKGQMVPRSDEALGEATRQLDRLKREIDAKTALTNGKHDDAIDILAGYAATLLNESAHDGDERTVSHYADSTVAQIATPAFFEVLLALGYGGCATVDEVEEFLLVDVCNRADTKLALLYGHAAADQAALDGIANQRDPRQIGLDATYNLHEDMDSIRNILTMVGWRGASTADEVDLRFGRLVQQRAEAILQGDRSFVTEAVLRHMDPSERKEAESRFKQRVDADYLDVRPRLSSLGKRLFVDMPRTADEEERVDALVVQCFKSNIDEIRQIYADRELPDDDQELESMGLNLEGDYGILRDAIVARGGWRGLTEENVDRGIAMMVLWTARALRKGNSMLEIMARAGIGLAARSSAMVRRALAERVAREVLQAQASVKTSASERFDFTLNGHGRWTTPKGFDEFLMNLGVRFWRETYHLGMTDAAARKYADTNIIRSSPRAEPVDGNDGREQSVSLAHFATKWAVHAFQRVQSSHTFAAAMMATTTHPECADLLEMPWDAFMVHVPSGLLQLPPCPEAPSGGEFNRLLVASYEFGAELHLIDTTGRGAGSSDGLWSVVRRQDVAALLLEEQAPKTTLQRAELLARRLVTGLLFAMQVKSNVKERTVKASRAFREGKRHDEPEHRIVIVGEPILVDCREAIASYIAKGSYVRTAPGEGGTTETKKRSAPQVQTLVRGHRKRQVYGVGRLQRKIIFVESYWKGPEGAPILTKPKRVVGRPSAPTEEKRES
jgi:hypothetical protein